MTPRFAAKVVALAVGFVTAIAHAQPSIGLKSISVDLPDSDRQFAGPGADPANGNCLACHSADMVLNQPMMTREQWQGEVDKMIARYNAPVATQDVADIVDYLAKGAN